MNTKRDSWKLVGKIREWFDSRVPERVQAAVERLRKWFGRPLVPE